MATGDITSCTIITETNGMPYLSLKFLGLATGGTWAYGFGANNDPSTAKIVLTVTSSAFDAAGNATTAARVVYGTRVMRQAYPNDAQDDVATSGSDAIVHIAISDFIYSGETVTISVASGLYTVSAVPTNALSTASVTNNSTNAHSKPIARWATVPYQRINGSFTFERVAYHRFAKNGKPLACVKFIATDQHGHSVTFIATGLILAPAGASGIKVPTYQWSTSASSLVAAGLTDGDTITLNAEDYPWIGTSARKSDLIANGGDGYADCEFDGPITFLLDSSGSNLPELYTVVDSATGSSSGVASTTLTTAETTRCDTIATAKTKLAAIRTNGENCVIYLVDNGGTGYAFNGSSVSFTQTSAARIWCKIAPHPTLGTLAGCPISSGNNTIANGKMRFTGLTISGTSVGAIRGTTTIGSGYLWTDGCIISIVSTSAIYSWYLAYATDCTISTASAVLGSFSTNRGPFVLVRGTQSSGGGTVAAPVYCVLGCKMLSFTPTNVADVRGHASGQNAVCAYNSLLGTTVGQIAPSLFAGTGVALSTTSNNSIGASTLTVACASGTTYRLVAGDRITFRGDTTNYTVQSTVTLTTGGVSVSISPTLAAAQDGSVTPITVQPAYEGLAWCCNAMRRNDNVSASSTHQISADGSIATVDHAVIWHNTLCGVGTSDFRWSMGYNEFNDDRNPRRNWSFIGNNLSQCNIKADTFVTSNAARTGAWTNKYNLGGRGNFVATDAGGGIETFGFDFAGLYSIKSNAAVTVAATLTAMALTDPTNGVLTCTSASPARNKISAGHSVLPYDIVGNIYDDNGHGTAGAYQLTTDIQSVFRRRLGNRSGSRGM